MKRVWLSCLLAPALTVAPLHAQTGAEPPRDYALINARVVMAPGRILEQGTILVRNGRIAEVGPSLRVPPDLATLDLAGLTVYPGLIDVANSTGLPRATPQGSGRGGGASPATEASGPPTELDPGRAAADVFTAGDADLDPWRRTGITTLGLVFTGGIFPGRVSAVNLTGGDVASMVVRSPVAQQVAFGRRGGGAYPSTGIGVVAYIRQSFLDARWEQQAEAAFQRDPASARRPEYDAEHRELASAAAGAMPVWFAASARRELQRAIGLADELGVDDYVLVGAQEGYQAVPDLEAAGKPVVVSLDYPEVDRVTGRVFELHVAPISGDDPEKAAADSTVLRSLRANAATLVGSGIPVALSGYGLSGPTEFRDRVLGAVEAGLPAEEALRALTVTPARLLGLERALGTVEAGKLANLVVVQGDLFSNDGKIRQVFVEGRRFVIPEAAARPAGGRGGGGGVAANGEWVGELEGPNGLLEFTLTITADGAALTGRLATEMGPVPLRGEQNGADLILRGTFAQPGMNATDITITARVSATELRGTLDAAGTATVPFNARRRGPGGARPAASSFEKGGRP
ncbi:MAG: amidohydrolase family protein [Gemmatimonadota bacterium]|jgi:imidazolonepropionase-like amidohydrolase